MQRGWPLCGRPRCRVHHGVESGLAIFEALTTAYRHKRTERPALWLAWLDRTLMQVDFPSLANQSEASFTTS